MTDRSGCQYELIEKSGAIGQEVLCEASAAAVVTCQGDSLRACHPHAAQLARTDPDAAVTWFEPEAEL